MTAPSTLLHILVVDDEAPARDRLKRLLSSMVGTTVVGEAADGQQALDLAIALRPDLVLLDVQMPELDGLAVAAALAGRDDAPRIVFTTAHEEHALRAFELAALDYLLKPVEKERLERALTRARAVGAPAGDIARAVAQALGARPRPSAKMAVRSGAKFVVFDASRVAAVLAQDRYAAILVDGRELLTDESLDTLMTRLDPARFLRVHRSAIVNVDVVGELLQEGERKYVAVLAEPAGLRVPIARDRLDEVKARFGAR